MLCSHTPSEVQLHNAGNSSFNPVIIRLMLVLIFPLIPIYFPSSLTFYILLTTPITTKRLLQVTAVLFKCLCCWWNIFLKYFCLNVFEDNFSKKGNKIIFKSVVFIDNVNVMMVEFKCQSCFQKELTSTTGFVLALNVHAVLSHFNNRLFFVNDKQTIL